MLTIYEIGLILVIIIVFLALGTIWYKRTHYDAVEEFENVWNNSVRVVPLNSHNDIEGFSNTIAVKASDGSTYNVSKSYNNKQLAADILADVHRRNLLLIKHLQQCCPNKTVTKNLVKRYSKRGLFEIDPKEGEKGAIAYSLKKGKEFGLCVRNSTNPDTWSPADMNAIEHVAIHELAHIGSTSYGTIGNPHNKEFRDNFAFLLHEADKIGVYKITDFSKNPTTMCGKEIVDKM